MKKIIIGFLGILMFLTTFSIGANAADYGTRASAYFRSTEVWADALGDGEVSFGTNVYCNREMTKIGVSKIQVQQKISNQWKTIITDYGTVSNKFLAANKSDYTCFISYNLTEGQTYRAIITAYAGDSNGSDTKERTTNAVVA